jgi:hypothetical protein
MHCRLLPPLNSTGSICGACWLTSPNEHSFRTHTAVSECACWLSHYPANVVDQWRVVMTDG